MEDSGKLYAVLNIKRITDQVEYPDAETVSFEGEEVEERLARRHKRWTPVVGEV